MEPRFKIVGPVLEGIILVLLASVFLFSVIVDSVTTRYLLVFFVVIFSSLFIYKIGLVYDDKITIKYPLIFFKKDFFFQEVEDVLLESRFTVRLISFKFKKPVMMFRFANFSGSHPFHDIEQFLSSKGVSVKYNRTKA